jgi:hypothetical protein
MIHKERYKWRERESRCLIHQKKCKVERESRCLIHKERYKWRERESRCLIHKES